MSSSWQVEYLAALKARDDREKANYDLLESYAKLADRTARLAETRRHPPSSPEPGPPPKSPRPGSTRKTTGLQDKASTPVPSTDDDITQLKSNLSEAQRSKAELQSRLKTCTEELEKLKKNYQETWSRTQELSTERTALATRLRDKEEELRGKAKLLEDVQDEVISLNIQLNIAEKRAEDLQKENRELVDRWMERMGQEADAMNDASKFT
ncbi:MAG: hypothetical protein M1823_000349 [Watsoniomyces obsoletus]|nr:MAG: hypothetical protein M1823_000349 [Watsoniomyces obsoletus]